ncbi:MAG: glutaminyl-peptide cyclotransferase [Candidatus Bathyarchaeia archaeon]
MKKWIALSVVLIAAVILGASLLIFLNNKNNSTGSTASYYTYSILNTYPHDTNSFTEGLWYSDGFMYESSGSGNSPDYQSTLRQVDLATGKIVQEYTLPIEYFGEGIAVVNDTIIQLTWQSNVGFIYNKTTFALLGNFTYPTQGWGLTYNGTNLIMSDGSDHLYFLNPTTFQRVGEIQVHDGNSSVTMLNSLDYIKGDVYANVWMTNKIAIINPDTGQVKAWIDLTGLPASVASKTNMNAVLNGIAYDPQGDKLFVTGKDWTNLYQIKLIVENKP